MSYLNSSLASNEQVHFTPVISWVTYTDGCFKIISGILTLKYAQTLRNLFPSLNHDVWYFVGAAFIIFGILGVLAVAYSNVNTEIALTNKRVLYKKGWLIRSIHEISLSKIEAVDISQGFIDHMCDTGEITITGSGGTKITIPSIDDPVSFRRTIAEHSNL